MIGADGQQAEGRPSLGELVLSVLKMGTLQIQSERQGWPLERAAGVSGAGRFLETVDLGFCARSSVGLEGWAHEVTSI